MIRLKRTLRKPKSRPEEAAGGGRRHLRLVVSESGEAPEEDAPEQVEAAARRPGAPETAYEDPHSFVRTYVDPRNIYLA